MLTSRMKTAQICQKTEWHAAIAAHPLKMHVPSLTRELATPREVRYIDVELCMDWDEIRALAGDPLCTIGAHTLTHPMLAKHEIDFARREMADSKAMLEKTLHRPVDHMAYPVGDKTSAGPREFMLAREIGYRTAVTTRPGMLFPDHASHATALPRVSINGNWQNGKAVDILLSGAPFALRDRVKRAA